MSIFRNELANNYVHINGPTNSSSMYKIINNSRSCIASGKHTTRKFICMHIYLIRVLHTHRESNNLYLRIFISTYQLSTISISLY
jgi:hypothetical protein